MQDTPPLIDRKRKLTINCMLYYRKEFQILSLYTQKLNSNILRAISNTCFLRIPKQSFAFYHGKCQNKKSQTVYPGAYHTAFPPLSSNSLSECASKLYITFWAA